MCNICAMFNHPFQTQTNNTRNAQVHNFLGNSGKWCGRGGPGLQNHQLIGRVRHWRKRSPVGLHMWGFGYARCHGGREIHPPRAGLGWPRHALARCIPICEPGIEITPHPRWWGQTLNLGGGEVHLAFNSLNYLPDFKEMLVADPILFQLSGSLHRTTAESVVTALLASEPEGGSLKTLGF